MIVGRSLITNNPYLAYIKREVEQVASIATINFLDENDAQLLATFQQHLEHPGNLVVFASKQSFTTISKLIATLTDDTLSLKEGFLIPSKSSLFDDNSFLTTYHQCQINAILAEPGKTLPMILIDPNTPAQLLHIFDTPQADALTLLEPLCKTHEIALEPTMLVDGWLQIGCRSKKYGNMEQFLEHATQLFEARALVAENPFQEIIRMLAQAQRSLTFAESCTGGLIAARLTQEAGSSAVLKGSVVSYSNPIKAGWLGVEIATIQQHGAVSEACVNQMLEGIFRLAQADYALAVSGIAGPSGGSDYKPVGTVVIGIKSRQTKQVETLLFEGDRNYIQQQSMLYAYKLLLQRLQEEL